MFHSYDTRNTSDLFISGHNTKLFEESITYNSVLIYNKLSHEIKNVTCKMKCKKIINFLLEKSFYFVKEFMITEL
jgi:hypothetical protein